MRETVRVVVSVEVQPAGSPYHGVLGEPSPLLSNGAPNTVQYGQQQPPPSSSTFLHHANLNDVFRAFVDKAKALTCRQWLIILTLIALLMTGNALQIIAVNFWLRSFHGMQPSPFTTFFVSNLMFVIFFTGLLLVYWLSTRPQSARFAFGLRALNLIFWIGFFDAINSWMSIYATVATPEILQSLFTSLGSIFTFIMSKFILKDPRDYCNKWALSAFFMMILGVGIASAPDFVDGARFNANKIYWSLIFFFSVPTQSFYNVLQAKYMKDYTFTGTQEEYDALPPSEQQKSAGDNTVKFVMLFGDTLIQLLVSFVLLPTDALPWWGQSATVSDSWTNFADGIRCLFNCDLNGLYCILYSAGFIFTYVGCAYLNHYSATLCSMICQLSSPITAIILIIVPTWNLNQGAAAWYYSVIAVVLLTAGTVVYSIWEEMSTLDEEEQQQHQHQPANDGHDERAAKHFH